MKTGSLFKILVDYNKINFDLLQISNKEKIAKNTFISDDEKEAALLY